MVLFCPSAQTLHGQVGDSMVTIDWGEDPRVWLKVQDTVSGGRGVLFASFLHYSVVIHFPVYTKNKYYI